MINVDEIECWKLFHMGWKQTEWDECGKLLSLGSKLIKQIIRICHLVSKNFKRLWWQKAWSKVQKIKQADNFGSHKQEGRVMYCSQHRWIIVRTLMPLLKGHNRNLKRHSDHQIRLGRLFTDTTKSNLIHTLASDSRVHSPFFSCSDEFHGIIMFSFITIWTLIGKTLREIK